MRILSRCRLLIPLLLTLACWRLDAAGSCPAAGPHAPFEVSPGVHLNYKTVGDGPVTMVAIHGFGASLETWDDIAPILTNTGRYRIFMIDMLGFGRSDRSKKFSYSIQQQTEAAAAFVECVASQAPSAVTLMGHSYGGSIAMGVFGLLEDRHLIDRLILIDALAFPGKVKFPWYIQILRVPVLNSLVLNLTSSKFQVRLILDHIVHNRALVTKARVHRYAQFLKKPGSHRSLIKTAGQLGDKSAATWLKDQIRKIDMPTLIVWGSEDPLIPPSQADLIHSAIASSLPPSLVAATGHVPQEEMPQETAKRIEAFLNHP